MRGPRGAGFEMETKPIRIAVIEVPTSSALKAFGTVVRTPDSAGVSLEKFEALLSEVIAHAGLAADEWLTSKLKPIARISRVPRSLEACQRAVQAGSPIVLTAPRDALSVFIRNGVEQALGRPAPERTVADALTGVLSRLVRTLSIY